MEMIKLGFVIAANAASVTIQGSDGIRYVAVTGELPYDTKVFLSQATEPFRVTFDIVSGVEVESVYLM